MSSLNQLLYLGKIEKYPMDDFVFYQGEKGYSLYLLLKGKVGVYINNNFDGGEYLLSELNEGDVFGEMSVISGVIRSATVRALTDIAVLKINKEHFGEFLTLEPRYAENLLKTIAKRYYETTEKSQGGGQLE